jgi:hypothetical protein
VVVAEADELRGDLPTTDPGGPLGGVDEDDPGRRGDLDQVDQQGRDLLADVAEVEVLLELVQEHQPHRHLVLRVPGDLAGELAFRADVDRQRGQPLVAVLHVGLDLPQRLQHDLGRVAVAGHRQAERAPVGDQGELAPVRLTATVEHGQLHVRVKRGVQREGAGGERLALPRLRTDQDRCSTSCRP